jgi:hypothetical protein
MSAPIAAASKQASASLAKRAICSPSRSPLLRFTPSDMVNHDNEHDSSHNRSPNNEITVYRKQKPIRIPPSPIGSGSKCFVSFVKSISSASPAPGPTDQHARTNSPNQIGLGLGRVSGFHGTISVVSPKSDPTPSLLGLASSSRSNSVPSSVKVGFQRRTIATSPVGLGLGKLSGFYGTITTMSDPGPSSTVSPPSSLGASSPVVLRTSPVEEFPLEQNFGLGFSFISFESDEVIATSLSPEPLVCAPFMVHSLSEPQDRKNFVFGPFLVPINYSPVLPLVPKSHSTIVRSSKFSP